MTKKMELCLAMLAASAALSAAVAKVDPDRGTGPVKPVNGVGQPPMIGPRSPAISSSGGR